MSRWLDAYFPQSVDTTEKNCKYAPGENRQNRQNLPRS
jgi:hypothetical protein